MGAFKPNLTSVILEPCCKRTLDDIRYRLKMADLLQKGLLPLVFVSVFIGPAGKGSALTTINSIYQTDWAALAGATALIPEIARYPVKLEAAREVLKHTGNLHNFWQGIYDAF